MPCTTKTLFILLSLTLAFFSAPRASAGVIYYAYGDGEITLLGSNLADLAVGQQYINPICCQIDDVFWNGSGYYTYLNGYIASLGSNLSNLAFGQGYLTPSLYIQNVSWNGTDYYAYGGGEITLLGSNLSNLVVGQQYINPICCQIDDVFWNGSGYYTYLNGYIVSLGSNLSNLAFGQGYLTPSLYIQDAFAVETATVPEPSSLVMLVLSLVVGLAVRSHYRLRPSRSGLQHRSGPL
jgi:hypothetical protein